MYINFKEALNCIDGKKRLLWPAFAGAPLQLRPIDIYERKLVCQNRQKEVNFRLIPDYLKVVDFIETMVT